VQYTHDHDILRARQVIDCIVVMKDDAQTRSELWTQGS